MYRAFIGLFVLLIFFTTASAFAQDKEERWIMKERKAILKSVCTCAGKAKFADAPDLKFELKLDSCIKRAHAMHAEAFNLIYGYEALNYKYRVRVNNWLLQEIRDNCDILKFRLGLTLKDDTAKASGFNK